MNAPHIIEPSATARNISITQHNNLEIKTAEYIPRFFYLIYNEEKTMKIEKISTIHIGKAFSVEEVQVSLPTGKRKTYDRVNHRDSVTILPVDEEGTIWFVRQYRIGSDKELLELPAGVMEYGEDPLSSAQREIREEIGMAAKSWKPLGSFYLAPGYCTEINYVFLAQDLYAAPLDMDEDEFLTIEHIPLNEVLAMVKNCNLVDGKSLAALGIFFQTER
jgi:ADP-ribose pyrophosphatase